MALSASIRHMSTRPGNSPARFAWLLLAAVWLPLLTLAQTPPPGVEEALRARVTQFLQYHVDGNFRKAYEMVAEDTKDAYFNSGKVQLKGFQILEIKFTDNFTKAAVTVTMSKTVNVAGTDIPVALPSTITWKIEDGKWVWYNEAKSAWVTPVGPASAPGPGAAAAAKSNDDESAALPKDLNDKSITAAAKSILQQVSVDKKEIMLAADKASEETVTFHNGMSGSVQLELNAPEIPGFTVKAEPKLVRAGGDVAVVFRYEPANDTPRKDPTDVQLLVQPLNQAFNIRVNFTVSGPLVSK